MLSRSFFTNFGEGPFPKIAGKSPVIVFIFVIIEELEKAMRQEFNVAEEKEVRLWNRYMTNMYEQLNKKENTLQDAGLYSGQIVVLEQKNEDGTWPRQTLVSKPYVFLV